MNKKALILGIITGTLLMRIFLIVTTAEEQNHDAHEHTGDVHVHADFLMILNDEPFDLTQDKYQSRVGNVLADDIHLHDNQGNIIHRHAEDQTLGDLLTSIGFTITDDCLTLDTGETYCTDTDNELALYVNQERFTHPAEYVLTDSDQTLLYYGSKSASELTSYFDMVTDEACIYTGTCPERGTPPPEACGLTCEVDASELYPE